MNKEAGIDQQLSLEGWVAALCNQSNSIDMVAKNILARVGHTLNCRVGSLWVVDHGLNALSHINTWVDDEDDASLEKMNKVTLFHQGEGVPGTIWAQNNTLWTTDVNNIETDAQKELLHELKLSSALGFPIQFQNNVLGVVVFYHHTIPEPQETLHKTLRMVGNQLGELIHRQQEKAEENFIREELYLKINELEEQLFYLRQTNQAKNAFLANISHEIRTPLNSVIGFTELMHSGKVGKVTDEHKELLGEIAKNSRHLLYLLNDILDITKIEAGQMHCQSEPTQLKTIVEDIHKALSLTIAEKNIRFEQHIDPALNKDIISDPDKLKQILFNYLSNAIKFTPLQGTITVRLTPEANENFFRLEVSDTGIGIEKKETEKLFMMFKQLNINYSKPYHGVGLGLALTRHLTELLGGRVGVESEPGKGSKFFAILPLIFVKAMVSKPLPRR